MKEMLKEVLVELEKKDREIWELNFKLNNVLKELEEFKKNEGE